MADPLSIAASVAGLLAAAGKVCSVTSNFIASTIDAPESAAETLQVVEEMRMTLSSVQTLMESLDSYPSSRKNLIQLDHLSIIITHSVLTLSKLESIICQKDGFRYRIRWVWHEKKVLSLLPRLESQKSSLAVMISVLQSESNEEASRCYDMMLSKVEEVLEQNRTLGQQLNLLENGSSWDTRSVKFIDDTASIRSRRLSLRNITSNPSASVPRQRPFSVAASLRQSLSRRDFELALEKSKVYNRSQSNETDISSFTTSTAPTNTWSMLSGLSLNDISVISAFRLPISLTEINNIAPGSTFSTLLKEQSSAEADKSASSTLQRSGSISRMINRGPQVTERLQDRLKGTPPTRMLEEYCASREPDSLVNLPTFTVMVVGDATALKTEMINTFLNQDFAQEPGYTPRCPERSRSTVRVRNELLGLVLHDTTGLEDYSKLRQTSYQFVDAFVVLSNKLLDTTFKAAQNLWIPEISSERPGTPYLMVGTYRNTSEKDNPRHAELHDCGVRAAEGAGAVRYLDCDVESTKSVGIVLGQAITAAQGGVYLRKVSRIRGQGAISQTILSRVGQKTPSPTTKPEMIHT